MFVLKIELSDDEALVLFEWLSCRLDRLPKDTDIWSDPHEIVLSTLLGQLEKTLVEPFAANYSDLVLAAHNRLLQRHT